MKMTYSMQASCVRRGPRRRRGASIAALAAPRDSDARPKTPRVERRNVSNYDTVLVAVDAEECYHLAIKRACCAARKRVYVALNGARVATPCAAALDAPRRVGNVAAPRRCLFRVRRMLRCS